MIITIEHGTLRILPSVPLGRFRQSLGTVHRELAEEYFRMVQEGFEAERSPAGAPWAPLAKATVKKRGSAHPILRVQGYLAVPHHKWTEEYAEVGSNLPYAALHQYGGEIKRQGGVARLYLKKFQRGPRKGKVRFSTAKDASYSREVNVGAHSVRIPARPWLFNPDGGIPRSWKERLTAIVLHHLKAAGGE